MPNLVFILIAGCARLVRVEADRRRNSARPRRSAGEARTAVCSRKRKTSKRAETTSRRTMCVVLEVGYRLIPMVDKGQDGELLKRIRGLRKKFAQDVASSPRRCISATTSN